VGPLAGLEPATRGLGNRCSIRLSYRGLYSAGFRISPSTTVWWPSPGRLTADLTATPTTTCPTGPLPRGRPRPGPTPAPRWRTRSPSRQSGRGPESPSDTNPDALHSHEGRRPVPEIIIPHGRQSGQGQQRAEPPSHVEPGQRSWQRPASHTPRAGGRRWQATRQRILERDHFTCQYCGAGGELVVDHIVCRSAGGSDADENLVAACKSCNEAKRKREAAAGKGQIITMMPTPTAGQREPVTF
jgi:5-methylcytosine-specific restriction protein A